MKIYLLFFTLLCHLLSFGRDCDTLEIKKLNSESALQLSKDVKLAYKLAAEAVQKSQNCPSSHLFYESILTLSKVFYQRDQPDSIIQLVLPVIKQLDAQTNLHYRAALNHKLSSAYTMMMQLELGLKYALNALKNYEALNDSANISNMYVNIGNIYQQQNSFQQSNKSVRKAETIALKLRNKTALGNVYNTLGILYAENNQLDSAEKFFLLSTSIREKLNDKTSVVWNYNNLGGLYVMMEKPKSAIVFLEKAFSKFEELENYDGQTSVANNLGELYMLQGNTKKALEYYSFSRKLYQKTKNPDNLENLYNNLSIYYDKMDDLKTAFKYSDSLIVLKDSLYGVRLDRSMAEMQVQYDSEKKDLQLSKNETELKLKEEEGRQKNIIIASILLLLVLSGFSTILFFRKKQLEQKFKLDTERSYQKDLRTKSIIEAEEKERRRIAQDLHDGIGQILSAAKLNLSSLEATLNPVDEAQRFALKNTLDLIDDSVKEVRTVSQNMMPNTLIKLGLASAIREFITKIGSLPNLKIDLEIVGLDQRLEESVETALYRAIQEIVNNIIKHANANKISIQLIRHDHDLSVVIEDNGIGFDTLKLNEFEGIGLKNILSRIEFINGKVHFDSVQGRGTTVLMDIPVA